MWSINVTRTIFLTENDARNKCRVCNGWSNIEITLLQKLCRNKKNNRSIRLWKDLSLALHLPFLYSKWLTPFKILFIERDESRLCMQFISPSFSLNPPSVRQTSSPFVPCSRLRESFYRAVSGGTRCERRTTSGPERGCPFSPAGVTQSADPVDLAVACDFYGVTRFPADITFDIYIYIRDVDEGPICHGRLELRPYATGISRVPERDS